MNANVYTKIAERYGVPGSDDEAVERFFLDVAPTLSIDERTAIVEELSKESDAPLDFEMRSLPNDAPAFSIEDAPPVSTQNPVARLLGELSAEIENRINGRLDLVVKTVERMYERLARRSAIQTLAENAESRQSERDTLDETEPMGNRVYSVADVIEGRSAVVVDGEENVSGAAQRMRASDVDAVVVLSDGTLIGIFSKYDVVNRVVAEGRDPSATSVQSVMTKDIAVADPEETAVAALERMLRYRCSQLPVVAKGRLVGMITLRDLLDLNLAIHGVSDVTRDALGSLYRTRAT